MRTGWVAGMVLCGAVVCAAWLWGLADGKRAAAELAKPPAQLQRVAVINLASVIQQCSQYRSLGKLNVVGKQDEKQVAALFRDVEAAARRYARMHEVDLVLLHSEPVLLHWDDFDIRSIPPPPPPALHCLYAAPGVDISKAIVDDLNLRR